jgi:hypothetical protein
MRPLGESIEEKLMTISTKSGTSENPCENHILRHERKFSEGLRSRIFLTQREEISGKMITGNICIPISLNCLQPSHKEADQSVLIIP